MSTKSQEKFLLHESLGFRLSLVSRMVERIFEERLSQLHITRSMWAVLLAVEQESCTKPSEIADFVGIDRTAVSRLLRALEEKKLVSRSPGLDDRRARAVTVTASGKKVLRIATNAAHDTARWYKGKLKKAEQEQLHALLGKLLEGEALDVPAL